MYKLTYTKKTTNFRHLNYASRRVTVKKYQCVTCGFIYDESLGLPDEGISAGTKWEDIPDDWVCPECATAKTEFVMLEV